MPWEEDTAVTKCPFCFQEFSTYTFRRSHCRTCGRVVCADPFTGCSTNVALSVAVPPSNLSTEKPSTDVNVDVQMCKECHHTIFSKADFTRELSSQPPDQRAYQILVQFERGIRLLLPKFQRLLVTLQDPEYPPTPAQLTEATKVRKRLMDSFTQYDLAARRIRDMPSQSPTQLKLQKAIYAQASSFLHLHMLPLKNLPKVLKHATPNGKPYASNALGSIKYNQSLDASSQASSSSAISQLKDEEKELGQRLIVLEEQRFLVGEMAEDARKRRKFDEVKALQGNLADLDREIDGLRGNLERVSKEFRGVYEGEGVG